MANKDLIERMIDHFELMVGKIKNRPNLRWAIEQTLSQDDLRVYFLIPGSGHTIWSRLETKAKRAKIPLEMFKSSMEKLHKEGFINRYTHAKDGLVYEQTYSAFVGEMQVRRKKGTPLGRAFADFWADLAEDAAETLPTKTPYYRALPVEATITGSTPPIIIPVNVAIPDPRAVLPIDIVSEMIKKEPLMAVSECYCRLASREKGKTCEHMTECCFMFNEAAESLIEAGVARKINYDEAMTIIRKAELEGLVHHVDNAEGHINSLCNCCSCCCPVIKAEQRGKKNIGAPSRFVVKYEPEKCTMDGACVRICPVFAISMGDERVYDLDLCIGCGLCVTVCPEGAIHMISRPEYPKIAQTSARMWDQLRNEAIWGMTVGKLIPKK
jgi:Fe-S-cluster-containing hydrogenase component 2